MSSTDYRPHDLLWIADPAALTFGGDRPAWARPGWLGRAPVVVRRAPREPGLLPVGLRGRARHERCAAQVAERQVVRATTPEDVLAGWQRRPSAGDDEAEVGQRHELACLVALAAVARAWSAAPLAWGVTGGVGFSLASGLDTLRPDSDLDLLVRAPMAADAAVLRRLARVLPSQPGRVDVQVETGRGAFALAEWLRTGGTVLLRTDDGPAIVDDPWLGGAGVSSPEAVTAATGPERELSR
jgi:phosphoribosyl-dephospho-CoA transferase